MSAARRNKDAEMAKDLIKRGYPHGKRMTSPTSKPVPNLSDVGSAAYRKMKK